MPGRRQASKERGQGNRGARGGLPAGSPALRLRAPAPRCSRRARSLVFPPRSRAPRSSGWPGGGAPRQARPAASPGVGGGVGRGLGTELLQPWLGTWWGGRGWCGGVRGRPGPRRRSCQRREVSRAARGGDAVLSGVLHTPRRIPGLRVQIKRRGAPSACSSVHFPLPRLRGEGGPVARVSWTDPLSAPPALPVALTVLAGVWGGGSARRGKEPPPTGSARSSDGGR